MVKIHSESKVDTKLYHVTEKFSGDSINILTFLPWPRSEGSAMTIRNPFGMLFLRYQAVTRSENKLPHAQYTSDPQYFYRFWTPYKITISGVDKRCPRPP